MAALLLPDENMACEEVAAGGMSEVFGSLLFFIIGYACFSPRVKSCLQRCILLASLQSLSWSTRGNSRESYWPTTRSARSCVESEHGSGDAPHGKVVVDGTMRSCMTVQNECKSRTGKAHAGHRLVHLLPALQQAGSRVQVPA
mmetsp:Transcript_17596/g.40893  ORF Transcript_17596/g.40893 Transcript_17596/m.40893 type:complete len:143 (-) Transcript_17596:328-756(-)